MELARLTVGAVTIAADSALPPYLHLIDSRGNAYFAKQHRHSIRFDQEVHRGHEQGDRALSTHGRTVFPD
ncbi:hypothetical protein QMK28_30335 [Streptomyces sp. H27-D2]|nr:hypothetical protein [Streptomyces sp. H27-D2]